MDATRESEPTPVPPKHRTTIEKKSDRELVVTRTFNGPVHLVFEAWSKAELFRRWWVPKSFGIHLRSCEMDVRVGGTYRLVFGEEGAEPAAFYGKYLEVVPSARLVWTNEESAEVVITTVTFEAHGEQTRVVVHELHPSTEALQSSFSGDADGKLEAFDQLDELLASR